MIPRTGWRSRLWWWLAPTYCRPEARHDLNYWRMRQLSVDLAAFASDLQDAFERMGQTFAGLAATMVEQLAPAFREAARHVAAVGAQIEGARLRYQDDQPPGDGWPGGAW